MRLRCPLLLLFVCYLHPRGCLCKRGGNQASHAFFSIICKINLHTSIFCSTFAFGNRGGRSQIRPASGAFTFYVLLYVFRICKMIKLLLTFSFFQMLKIKHSAPSAVVHRHVSIFNNIETFVYCSSLQFFARCIYNVFIFANINT